MYVGKIDKITFGGVKKLIFSSTAVENLKREKGKSPSFNYTGKKSF